MKKQFVAAINVSEVKDGAVEAEFKFGLGYETEADARLELAQFQLLAKTMPRKSDDKVEYLLDLHVGHDLEDTVVASKELFDLIDRKTKRLPE